uniref:Uncharacterized protein n=1 Tax=viral metagenome TaxID=1070528 RepID=A0A2V0RB26_9ZZZZ
MDSLAPSTLLLPITSGPSRGRTLVVLPEPEVQIRDSLLNVSLVFDDSKIQESDSVQKRDERLMDILLSALNSSEFSSTYFNQLVEILRDRSLFSELDKALGDRVGVLTVSRSGGTYVAQTVGDSLPLTDARRFIIRARRRHDNVIEGVRTSEAVSIETDMNGKKFTYLTLSGARMPIVVDSRSEALSLRDSDTLGKMDVLCDFSRHVDKDVPFHTYDVGEGVDHSTSAENSGEYYNKRPIKIKLFKNYGNKTGLLLQYAPHAATRMKDYGFGNGETLMLTEQDFDALISGGRSVPDVKMERFTTKNRKAKGVSTRLTLEVPGVHVSHNGIDYVVTLILGVLSSVMHDDEIITVESFVNLNKRLELKENLVKLITVIPTVIGRNRFTITTTGVPVIPSHLDFGDIEHPVNIIPNVPTSAENRKQAAAAYATVLSSGDQWLNIHSSEIRKYCSEPLRRSLLQHLNSSSYAQITKAGVEFEDVEYIRTHRKGLFNELLKLGHHIFKVQWLRDVSIEEISEFWNEYFEKHSTPSIVHSGEIRSPSEVLNGTKPIDAPLLLVRVTLSLLLIVGLSKNMKKHNPTNINMRPDIHHLLSEKRAKLSLIPLCVLKSRLLAYEVSGSVGRLLNNVADEALGKSILTSTKDRSRVKLDDERVVLNMEDAASAMPFEINAPVIKVNDSERASRRGFTVVTPSGVELDVYPICESMCARLRSYHHVLERNRVAIFWHPIFCIIASATVVKPHPDVEAKSRYRCIILPSLRPSTMAPSYHNTRDSIRLSNYGDDSTTHYGVLKEMIGYISSFATYASMYL